eukprot:1877152-Pleurochrysis_carterae.AAC.8
MSSGPASAVSRKEAASCAALRTLRTYAWRRGRRRGRRRACRAWGRGNTLPRREVGISGNRFLWLLSSCARSVVGPNHPDAVATSAAGWPEDCDRPQATATRQHLFISLFQFLRAAIKAEVGPRRSRISSACSSSKYCEFTGHEVHLYDTAYVLHFEALAKLFFERLAAKVVIVRFASDCHLRSRPLRVNSSP